ncbi:MAG: 6-phosphogluconolactonase [Planctomycetota bacterium]
MTDVRVSEDPAGACATHLAACLGAALAKGERASLAVCGGSTPGPTYRQLAGAPLDWARVDIYFGDERCVPPDHADSTFRLIEEQFLAHIEGPPPTVLRMRGEDPDYDAAARDYAALLPAKLDVALLGMGPDGHTASLFPGDPALLERGAAVLHIVSPKPPPHRLSLTPQALAAAHERVMLVTGAGKAAMVARVLEGEFEPKNLPAQIARDGSWFLDPAAAAGLKS